MICVKCLGRTIVIETRTPEKHHNKTSIKKLLDVGDTVFGWWSSDFEMRRRRCSQCGLVFNTIEVSEEDLRSVFDEISRDNALGRPWDPNNDVLPQLDENEIPTLDEHWRTQSNLCR